MLGLPATARLFGETSGVLMTHESLNKPTVHRLSDRKFGLAIGTSFAVIGLFPLLRHHPIRIWALAISGILILTGLAVPKLLGPLNLIWSKVAYLLNFILLHVSGAFLLFFLFAPLNLLFRLTGRDALRLRRDPSATSYWISRTPPGPAPETMINQY
jgi:hypothetical protein